mmetsp:Transcript_41615/g.97425  ORF Transcript_41615/g.97425 Transcript_41615/m.97425 type:complete len:155 (-) Transcript_41615:112-576(-)
MADAGATRFIFQWEAISDNSEATLELVKAVERAGMKCGISINPSTPVENDNFFLSVISTGKVDVIDILAVEPGFGGQAFQERVLGKIRALKHMRERLRKNKHDIKLMVDGGMNERTSKAVVAAGADILVAGSFLFHHPKGLNHGLQQLQDNSRS